MGWESRFDNKPTKKINSEKKSLENDSYSPLLLKKFLDDWENCRNRHYGQKEILNAFFIENLQYIFIRAGRKFSKTSTNIAPADKLPPFVATPGCTLHETTESWNHSSELKIGSPRTVPQSSARKHLFPESLEDGELERVECSRFQTEFLGLLEFRACLLVLAFSVIRPGQVEARFSGACFRIASSSSTVRSTWPDLIRATARVSRSEGLSPWTSMARSMSSNAS